jgi:Zn-dependent M28 family amino/carboxypeptidase
MKQLVFSILSIVVCYNTYSQKALKVIKVKETERIEKMLSSDEMQGRRTFTPGIEKAANFIAAEFDKIGLQKWNNGSSYLQSFSMLRTKVSGIKATIDGTAADAKKVNVVSVQKKLKVDQASGYDVVTIAKGANYVTEVRKVMGSSKNTVVLVDTSHAAMFARFPQRGGQFYSTQSNLVLVLTDKAPANYSVELDQEITEMPLANVVGIIPGKSKPNEYVIFSGHYDHLGINTRNMVNNDSIYNGANDDAAGTTAMIMLAKYFSKLKDNERTLVFAAFTAEEIGGFGASYFSKQFDPAQVMAMFNIEMIGTESKWGKNSAYITGFEKTNMGEILQKNLEGTGFTFHPDPYPTQQLFYRSDNATLARLGVPAHTISTSKMDSEPNYHKASDEIGTLDMENMTAIIRAIALSSRGIVAGKETPTRVDTSSLR